MNYLDKSKTINGEYYAGLLQRLDQDVKNKRPHLAKKKVLFDQDNAPAHRSAITMMKLHELKYIIIPHLPYFPDLALCDFLLFLIFKNGLLYNTTFLDLLLSFKNFLILFNCPIDLHKLGGILCLIDVKIWYQFGLDKCRGCIAYLTSLLTRLGPLLHILFFTKTTQIHEW